MGEDAQGELAGLGCVIACRKGGAEAALVLAEPALGMPALIVKRLRKAMPHGTAIGCLRPAAAGVAAIEADHRLPHTEVFAAKAVVVLGIVAGIAQGGVNPNQACGLPHSRSEVRRVLARADARHSTEDEMGRRVKDGRQLRPGTLTMAASSAPEPEIGTHVARLEPGRIHRGHRRPVDQATPAGALDHQGLSAAEGPPASASARMRRDAWASVE